MAGNGKRTFGSVRKLPSGRLQARYTGPDGVTYTGRTPEGRARTFDSMQYADAYLARVSADIQAGRWVSPDAPQAKGPAARTFSEYAAAWLPARRKPDGSELADLTRELYAGLLESFILPALGSTELPSITPAMVRTWYAGLKTGPTRRAHAYALLRTIMGTAVEDELIPANPCRLRGAGQSKRARKIPPASLPELETLVKALPERYPLIPLLAASCAPLFP